MEHKHEEKQADMRVRSSDWLGIESAPKDREVLLFIPRGVHSRIEVGKWDDDRFAKKPRPYFQWSHLWGVVEQRKCPPTHWMPLPPMPNEVAHPRREVEGGAK